jgi:hypothetical protein
MSVDGMILEEVDVVAEGGGAAVTFDIDFDPATVAATATLSQFFFQNQDGANPGTVRFEIPQFATQDAAGNQTTHPNPGIPGAEVPVSSPVMFANDALRVTFSLFADTFTGDQVFGQGVVQILFFG